MSELQPICFGVEFQSSNVMQASNNLWNNFLERQTGGDLLAATSKNHDRETIIVSCRYWVLHILGNVYSEDLSVS